MNYLKRKSYNLLTIMTVLFTLILPGAIFLAFLGFGLYGLSRILTYFRLGDFTYNRSMYNNLPYYGSYIIFGYSVVFAVEHLMDYFRKTLPENAHSRGMTFHLISYTIATTLFYFIIHLNHVYTNTDSWVIMVIIGFLYICKLQLYPESKNLNNKK